MKGKSRIVIIRVRGKVHVRSSIEDTMKLLNLNKVNHCVVVDDRPQYMGMLKKVNDYVTWGEINPKTFEELIKKRGRIVGNKPLEDKYVKEHTKFKDMDSFMKAFMDFKAELKDISGVKPIFRLAPPKKGHARAGIKKSFSKGGALGYRGVKINELVTRML